MEHQVGVVGLGHGFAQGSDGPKAEEEALEGSQVQISVSQCNIMPNKSCSVLTVKHRVFKVKPTMALRVCLGL